ncbi:MAG TPA: hypothetical protein VK550_22315 [Polyangiaceae bacterium]|nr:hypothetical protein [Polyangiaceae bacterium]
MGLRRPNRLFAMVDTMAAIVENCCGPVSITSDPMSGGRGSSSTFVSTSRRAESEEAGTRATDGFLEKIEATHAGGIGMHIGQSDQDLDEGTPQTNKPMFSAPWF